MDGDSGTGTLRFTVLGPVRAWRGEEQLSTGSPQQRALLAALLLRRGRTATASELVDALWGEEPPDAALAALRTYASRLRKSFGQEAGTTLVTESGGYAIRVGPGGLDVTVAEEYAQKADKARHNGDRRSARDLLAAALDLWDGEPLAGLPGPYAESQRSRLDEWRLHLLESRIDLDLEAGHHTEVISELTALTADHPLRERLRAQLMLALYRSGRQAEALAVYADTRRLLAEELGVDPSGELRDLHQGILEADAGLAAPADGDGLPGDAVPSVVRPAQLPASVPDFTGRTAFVGELSEQLATAEGRIMAVSAVAGIGGVGKTTLAVHVAHAARERFPDGQLYIDLQGAGPRPAEPDAVLGSFLRALGCTDSAIPDSLDERSALYRSVLDGRRVLVLLDNARDAAQVRPLLPGTEGCAALITSRVRMVDLAGAHLVDLDVMSPEEALQLFTKIVGMERVAAERKAALDVVAACGFLPLAIRIAASRLASRRTWTVSVLAEKLGDERRRLDELQAGDLAVKATFELGYSQLEPQQARAFRLLGLADGPDISLAASAAMLGLDPYETEELLESLVDTSLLESAAPGRYRFHDLVRLYARACAERDEHPPTEREAALSRLLDFYLATAAQVYALERPGDRLPDHVAPTSGHGLAFADRGSALEWLFSEARCLLACAHQSTGEALLRRAADLLMVAKDLGESGADSRAYEQATLALQEAAQEAGDRQAEGRARVSLANVYNLAGRFADAEEQARLAMDAGDSVGDPVSSAFARNDRGLAAAYQSRYEDAETYLQQSLDLFLADGNQQSAASALSNLSRTHLLTDRVGSAVALAEQAVATYRELGVAMRLANGKYALGLALARAGRAEQAHQELTEALAIFRTSRQRLWEGMTHFRLAELQLAAGKPAQAASLAEQALSVLRGIGGEWRRANALTMLGRALNDIGQLDRARVCWQEALAVYDQLGSPEAAEVRALLQPLGTAA
ncbi:BTAD domain-containing putative transcriptional regulator [Streptomyces xinghaiensis]|uniref:AfsR/SARP family transcriptional regulator n=2 Tax=Streptomyces TaxID=1883 RepID=A0A3R7ET69_9ACTN|nr:MULTISPECIES: BTAD domain-containing putative transcriptional regulator [Streptomyces]KNE81959.1 regulator [Streptomyces fradiae]OFA51526.1 regulator [Streptomyces fradiae]PQM20769.1 AfsR/SARP family transcriptional regulator [Streptomyces xinghaiensis]RKM95912.1 AfsR/SARP family transcriptional regulator [Streptomyces xinghaiensis]RNC70893.1 AfsR/SARP family transcriptional regulator [Streptomyces xinghaiensis]